MTTRREFLFSTAAGSVAIAARRWTTPSAAADNAPTARARRPMSILVLGGTGFIGPYLVRHAVARGHQVTIFTRGRHQAELPESVTHLEGDRNGKLDALVGKRWDVVVDDSANVADWVRQSTSLLKGSTGRYLFTSSTGVYYPYLKRGLDEGDPVHYDLREPKDASESFGVAKAQGERFVFDAFGDRGIVVRPTYIVGPGDPSDRFPYWPVRLQKGGEVLAPGRDDDPVAFIDVRDLAEFMVKLLEDERSGVFNAVGPRQPMTARRFYEAARATINPSARLTFVSDYAFLTEQKIDESIPWVMLKDNDFGHQSVKNARALAAGLIFRPLEQTLRDTLAWWPTVPAARLAKPRFAITPETEVAALSAWHAKGG